MLCVSVYVSYQTLTLIIFYRFVFMSQRGEIRILSARVSALLGRLGTLGQVVLKKTRARAGLINEIKLMRSGPIAAVRTYLDHRTGKHTHWHIPGTGENAGRLHLVRSTAILHVPFHPMEWYSRSHGARFAREAAINICKCDETTNAYLNIGNE